MVGDKPEPCPWCRKPVEVTLTAGSQAFITCANYKCPVMPSTKTCPNATIAVNRWNHRPGTAGKLYVIEGRIGRRKVEIILCTNNKQVWEARWKKRVEIDGFSKYDVMSRYMVPRPALVTANIPKKSRKLRHT